MLVFLKQKLVLLATPKTGTTALESALAPTASLAILNPPRLKHTAVRKYRRHLAPWLEGNEGPLETVAVIREPLEWLGSWYRYRTRPGLDGTRSTADMSFEEFICAYLSDDPPAAVAVGSQARFLQGRGGGQVDHLFRHDRMDDLIAFLQTRLGQTIELPRLNVSPPGDLTLRPETEARLRAHCAADFALYESCA